MDMQDSARIQELLTEQNSILSEISASLKEGVDVLGKQNRKLEQVRFSVAADMQKEYYSKVLSRQMTFIETLDAVSDRGLSMARFGDGELGLAADPTRNIAFQRGSFGLARQLCDILSERREGLLVCLPGVTVDVFWMTWIARYWGILSSVISDRSLWGIASVSRSEAFRSEGEALVEAWRACWSGREITVVTGSGSRFEAPPELFSSAKSLDYVRGPSKDAFSYMRELKGEVLSRSPDLVLVALGPAGTILAADLHESGLQALDVGHLSNSYNEHFKGGLRPERLPIHRS